jgi:hypothetical protein
MSIALAVAFVIAGGVVVWRASKLPAEASSDGRQTLKERLRKGIGSEVRFAPAASRPEQVDEAVESAADPSSVNLPSPPLTVTVTGQSFDTTYGMPEVQYYDGNGYMIGSVYATSVSGGGTSLVDNVPDLYAAYSGTYQVKVTNKTSQGYYTHIVGSATIIAYGRDRLDSDGDGWYDDEDCYPYSAGCNCNTGYACVDDIIY